MMAKAGGQVDPNVQRAEQMLGDGFEIMQEELDEEYEPTLEEIEEYAKYLGMDMVEDRDLFYIAKEGLKAPLPDQWKPCRNRTGDIFYFNFETKQLQKDHPCDDYYKKYYITERAALRRKKEEQVIKKQIKQQKQVVQNMAASGGSTIQQMVLMNMSGNGLETSVINERVQIELEHLLDECEERKIQHERTRREEIRRLEQERVEEKRKIQDSA